MDKTTRTAYLFGPAEAGSLVLLCFGRIDAERVASGLYRSTQGLGRAVLGIIRDTCLASLQRDSDRANARHRLEGFGSTRYAVPAAQPLDRIDGSRQSGSRSGLRFAYTGYDLLEVSGLCSATVRPPGASLTYFPGMGTLVFAPIRYHSYSTST